MRRTIYTKDFKESAIALYHSKEQTVQELADSLGVHRQLLYRWLKESKEGIQDNIAVFPGRGIPRDVELAQLRKEVADLRESNEILKKVAAFFVEKTPQ
jgi:transposase